MFSGTSGPTERTVQWHERSYKADSSVARAVLQSGVHSPASTLRTTVPRPAALASSSDAPTDDARSRIPMIPYESSLPALPAENPEPSSPTSRAPADPLHQQTASTRPAGAGRSTVTRA